MQLSSGVKQFSFLTTFQSHQVMHHQDGLCPSGVRVCQWIKSNAEIMFFYVS